jgi:CrcB protein
LSVVFVAVALGSAIGGVLRYSLSVTFSAAFPWATFAVNAIGSFLIGVLLAVSAPGGLLPLSPSLRALLIPGFCGGLTTFSTFSADTVYLWEESPGRAVAYVAASVATALTAVWAGLFVGRAR